MKKFLPAIIIVIILIVMFYPIKLLTKYYLNDCPADGPTKQTDFEMYSEQVDLEKYKEKILSFTAVADISVLEKISYNEKKYEIYQIDVKNSNAKKNLLIFSATHGNEFASALVIPELLSDITQNQDFYRGWNIRIISPVNPVGLAYQSRYNENGCDINRDFKNFSTVGARVQKKAIEEFTPNAVITLHEGPQDGFFVIAENSTPRDLQDAIISSLKTEKVDLAKKSFLGIPLSDSGLWHKKPFVYILQRLFSIHTLGRYAQQNNLVTLTTESPWKSKDVEARKKPHLIVIKTVAESLK